jgi:hypothetical protein
MSTHARTHDVSVSTVFLRKDSRLVESTVQLMLRYFCTSDTQAVPVELYVNNWPIANHFTVELHPLT